MILPPGRPVTSVEWQTDCPSCGKENHFYINQVTYKNHCKRCGYSSWKPGSKNGWKKGVLEDFGLDDDDDDPWFGLTRRPKTFKEERGYSILSTVNAWTATAAQAFLRKRGITERACERGEVRWVPQHGKMVVEADPYTQDLSPKQLLRMPRERTKWYPAHEGISLSEYCYGWRYLRRRNKGILVVEGLLDLLALDLVGYGIALLGTSITLNGIEKIAERFTHLVMWMDPDIAGRKFIQRYQRAFRSYGMTVEVLGPEFGDPKHWRPAIFPKNRPHVKALREFCENP